MPTHRHAFRLTLIAATIMGVAQADELAPVQVQAEALTDTPNVEMIIPTNTDTRPVSDAGEALREVPGVSASRMSQHGVDPIIRGQTATQLNVLLDGGYVHGGCPNRMDTPSSFATFETYDRVVVEKGVQSVQHGMGGSGGTVLYERDTAAKAATPGLQGHAGIATSSNGLNGAAYVDGMYSNGKAYVRAFGEYSDADSYKDGDGNKVPSATTKTAGGVVAGYRISENAGIEGTIEAVRGKDTLYAGADMDAPKDDMNAYRLKYWNQNMGGAIDGVKVEAWRSDVDHLMDNHSLRTPPAMTSMYRDAPSEVSTQGARLTLTSKPMTALKLDYGLDIQDVNRKGWIINPSNPANILGWLWPDATLRSVGGFAEGLYSVNAQNRIKAGLRVDQVTSSIDSSLKTGSILAVHPEAAEDQKNTAVGGLLRYEHDLSKNLTAFAGISRSVRQPDATERYVAQVPKGWVGNPTLDPEKHTQLDVGLAGKGKGYKWDAVVFYDDVNDFVLREAYNTTTKTSYRNIDATLWGAELSGQYMLTPGWHTYGAVAYVRATNDTDNGDIPQIPALNGRVGLDYSASNWHAGGRVRFADRQTNVDYYDYYFKTTGQETPGYAVLDLYGGYNFTPKTSLKVGVNNVFDKLYAEHVNRSFASTWGGDFTLQERIYEPGRTFWARLDTKF